MPRGLPASDRRLALGLFLVPFVTYAWFFSGGGWNQAAHFDLARALVERQTLYIDGYRVNTGDVSWSPVGGEWHAYINKPPGASFMAAVPYAVIYAVERARGVNIDGWLAMTVNAWLVTLLTCGVTGALIPVVLYRYGRRRAGAAPLVAVAAALTIAFCTIVFPFSTAFLTHVPSALFLLLAFYWLDERPLLAGAAAGIAGTCNYLCIVAAAVLGVALLIRSWRNALRFVAGGVPFGLALAWYHDYCFGSPFTTAAETSRNFAANDLILGFFARPTWEAFHGITVSEYRGLFFSSPVLLLAFAGAAVMLRRRTMRRELAVVAALVAIFILINSSFNYWHGAGSFGPRHLLAVVPLFAVPMLFVNGRVVAALWVVLALLSAGQQFLAAAVDPLPSGAVKQPTRMYHLPVFSRGRVPPELVREFGWAGGYIGKVSVNQQAIDEITPHSLHPPGSKESTWASFNAGELAFGAGHRTSVVPIALWMLGGSALLLASARRSW
ncbi:MAG TPA: glycosyltransferase 87 family protein [Thermoanaerobaculia bacterium]|jgi:hypothetical protein